MHVCNSCRGKKLRTTSLNLIIDVIGFEIIVHNVLYICETDEMREESEGEK